MRISGRGRVADLGYRHFVKPVLFRLDPERAHHISLRVASAVGAVPCLRSGLRALMGPAVDVGGGAEALRDRSVEMCGLRFPNRVGLAAGMDKNGVAVPAWSAAGFGHVEVGTVTAVSQPGNPRPRLVRLPHSRALVNAMGFNNTGAARLAERLREDRKKGLIDIPVGVSIGKSKVTPVDLATVDYLASLAAVKECADYIAVNVSSPNTPGVRSLQDADPLRELLTELVRAAGGLPILVKVAPDLSDAATDEALQVATDAGIAGLIAGNTTLLRNHVDQRECAAAQAAGGLSGHPLTQRSRRMVGRIARSSDFPVIGVGGIMTTADAKAMLEAGASLVQLYTGLIYGGPALINGIRSL